MSKRKDPEVSMAEEARQAYGRPYPTSSEIDSKIESGMKGGRESSCFIATAVYGSYDAPEVIIFRKFRDEQLGKYRLGRFFIKLYYRLSPPVANRLGSYPRVMFLVRKILDAFATRIVNSSRSSKK